VWRRKKEWEERSGGERIKRKSKHVNKEKNAKVLCRSEQLKFCVKKKENKA
jgi:hypothetical protein